MQRDSTVIQAAILLIIIAILGVAILKKQQPVNDLPTTTITRQTTTTTTYSGSDASTGINVFGTGTPKGTTTTTTTTTSTSGTVTKSPPLVDNPNSPAAQLVKNYFSALASQDFVTACGLLSPAKCAPTRPSAVASFSTEYLKLVNGYEYLAVRDYGFTSPSGKDIVCVKYSYTYKDDARPAQISEVYSYYTSEVNGKLAITDRVCEKKYKDGGGTRPCPIQATQNFCLGKIK